MNIQVIWSGGAAELLWKWNRQRAYSILLDFNFYSSFVKTCQNFLMFSSQISMNVSWGAMVAIAMHNVWTPLDLISVSVSMVTWAMVQNVKVKATTCTEGVANNRRSLHTLDLQRNRRRNSFATLSFTAQGPEPWNSDLRKNSCVCYVVTRSTPPPGKYWAPSPAFIHFKVITYIGLRKKTALRSCKGVRREKWSLSRSGRFCPCKILSKTQVWMEISSWLSKAVTC